MTLYDLSHPLAAGMPVYPGDPAVSIQSATTVAADGAKVSQLQLGSHAGTHVDAPAHVVDGGATVDQLDLDLLVGAAHILHARSPGSPALRDKGLQHGDLAALPDQLPNIVCIATGWDQYFHTALRAQHPYLELELVHALWRRGARVLGVDTLSPDPTSGAAASFAVHEFWLGSGGVIVENLRGLTGLSDRVQMSLLPLNLRGLDGSPIRAVAWD